MSGTGEEVGCACHVGDNETLVSWPLGGPSSGWKEGNSKLGLRFCLKRCQLISRQEESGNKSGKKKLKNEKGPSTLHPIS